MTNPDGVFEPFVRDWPLTRVIMPATRLMAHYFRARAVGTESIPRDRPVIYVGKHPRTYLYLETILLGLFAFWDSGRPPFRVLEQTGTSLHRAPLVGWVRRHVNALPASPANALRALTQGESLLIFPGGTRELYGPPDTLQWTGRTGFARIAIQAGAPVVPFAILGADRQHPWRVSVRGASVWLPPLPLPVRLDYRFGRPIEPPAPPASGEDEATAIDRFAACVETATRDLLAAAPRACRMPRAVAAAPPAGASGAARTRTLRAAREDEQGAPLPPLDPRRWHYRFCAAPIGRALSRYHRVTIDGTPPRGACIYVTHHGAGYLNLDLAIAVYQLGWHAWYVKGGRPMPPPRVVAARGHAMERVLPGFVAFKRTFGVIDPSERSCLAALERGEQLLITPGGHRESSPRARHYDLRWNERYGFVRLALRTGVPVVPLAVVGGYAAYPGFAIGRLSFWSPLPLPARLDIAVGPPIEISRQPERARDPAVIKPLQLQIRAATQALYDQLVARRRRAVR